MSIIINKTINKIINRYKFEYNPNGANDYEEAHDIYFSIFGRLIASFDDYHFYSRLEKINDLLKKKESKMKRKEFELYVNKMNELKVKVKNMNNQFQNENSKYISLFYEYKQKFNNNKDFPEVLNICRNVFKEFLNQMYEFSINNEKKFITISDQLIDINNNLNFLT